MRKDESKGGNRKKAASKIARFMTVLESLKLGFPPSGHWDRIKDTDEIIVEVRHKILQKKHPIKQKRDFDHALFGRIPNATEGRFSGEDLLKAPENGEGENPLKTSYEKIRSSANKEMQKQFKSATRQPEKVLYKFLLENPWNLREEWIIKTISDWQRRNYFATTKDERKAYKKKLEGIGKALVARTGEDRGSKRNIKPYHKFPRIAVDSRYSESLSLFGDLKHLMAKLTKIKGVKSGDSKKREFLEVVLDSDEARKEFQSWLWDTAKFKKIIEEHTEEIIDTSKEGSRGQIRELAFEIVSEVAGVSVGTLKKVFSERDRAVEFEVRIFRNKQFYMSWKI